MNSAIVLAAGIGNRMKTEIKKQYIEIFNKPIIAHTLDAFNSSNHIDEIILVVSEDDVEFCNSNIVKRYGYHKVSKIISGGKERQESVYNGLRKLDKRCHIVLIHDGARPLLSQSTIVACIQEAEKYGAVTAGMPAKDTIKIINENRFVNYTPNRNKIWITQTPQAFKTDIIIEAHEYAIQHQISCTDDSTLVELIGYKVKMVEAEYENIKITTPEDLISAEIILKKRQLRGC